MANPSIAQLLTLDPAPMPVEEARVKYAPQLQAIETYVRCTDFMAAAQIYLKDNALMREPLKPEHIKDRLLGHWGTCPGLDIFYAHCNRLIKEKNLNMLFVCGPGHGAPAVLSNLWLEGSLEQVYPECSRDAQGLQYLVRQFSWPGGFASHVTAHLPGSIHEGGELGYALAVAFGSVFDNPSLITCCVVGDGEAETGPTAAAWHSIKFLDPVESGAVIPILHVNGYKISNPTIYGTMSDEELRLLFSGYGYQVYIVHDQDLHADMYVAMDWALAVIHKIQQAARSGNPINKPKWPMICVRSKKGLGGIKSYEGHPIEGSYRSHQVPLRDVYKDAGQRKLLEDWLRSYRPQELFDSDGRPIQVILDQCPPPALRMGSNANAIGRAVAKEIDCPPRSDLAVDVPEDKRGVVQYSNAWRLGEFFREVIKRNPNTFRIFSPDELESNKLNAVFDGVTTREYQWPINPDDQTLIKKHGGRVLEILSEHTIQGWLQGYLLTGRQAIFPSYEAFLGIVTTMADQFSKFLKMSMEVPWRPPIPSLNYIETSTLWRQEHNGFSHQNPGFINSVINKKASIYRVYLPPDANTLICTMDHCLRSKNKLNLVITSKHPTPQWLTMSEAIAHCRAGASVWKWASTDNGVAPDVVLVGIGVEPTTEVMSAGFILKKELPELRLRIVNVTDLGVLERDSQHPHGLSDDDFDALFTPDRQVIFNFHGYPSAVKQLLFGRQGTLPGNRQRFVINGYREEGTTTTPFDMAIVNHTSRYHLIIQAIKIAAQQNAKVAPDAALRISHYEYVLRAHKEYIQTHGSDPAEISHFWEQFEPGDTVWGKAVSKLGLGGRPHPAKEGHEDHTR